MILKRDGVSVVFLASAGLVSCGAWAIDVPVVHEDAEIVLDQASTYYGLGSNKTIIRDGRIYTSVPRQQSGQPKGIHVYDAQTRELLHVVTDPSTNWEYGIGFDVADNYLVVISRHKVHVYVADTGEELYTFSASDIPTGARPDLGYGVATDGRHMAFSGVAQGVGRVFIYNVRSGIYYGRLIGDNIPSFGSHEIRMAGGLIAVTNSGIVQVFDKATRQEMYRVGEPGAGANEGYGQNVEFGMGRLFVTAYGADGVRGAVYVYDEGTGDRLDVLFPDHASFDIAAFGRDIAYDSGYLVVGASQSRYPGGGGYLFDVETGRQLSELLPEDPVEGYRYATTVAMEAGRVLLNAYLLDTGGGGYIDSKLLGFTVPPVSCAVDYNLDGASDFFDVSEFLRAFVEQDPVADLTNDGAVDFFDVSRFLAIFGEGCV